MGHWYLPNGTAWHFQPDGKATTLRHARKENALPSVTTILGILDKPALTNWKLKQVTGAAFDHINVDQIEFADYDEFHSAVMTEAFQDSTNQRDRGSEIHDCLESYFLGNGFVGAEDVQQIARAAADEICEYTGQHDITKSHQMEADEFIPEQTVVGDGYGGMVDLHNDDFVLDYKSKDGVAAGGKLHWPEMAMQLSAYEMALEKKDPVMGRRCINVFIDRQIPGDVVIHEWKPEEIELAWKKFQLLRDFWQLDKNYFPGKDA